MVDKIKVLIADDNKEFANVLNEFLSKYEDFEMLDIAYDGVEALEIISNQKPDVVVLDAIMPRLDGVGVMKKVKEYNLEKVPSFLVLSAISQEKIAKNAIDLGAYCFMLKPFEFESLAGRIKDIAEDSRKEQIKVKPKEKSNANIEITVTNIMHEMGIPAHIKGYKYLREAIMQVIDNNNMLESVTKELYPIVATKFDTVPNKVERSIRHAIEIAWRRGNLENFKTLFGYTRTEDNKRPTNSEFIAMVADKIQLEMKL